MASWPTYRGENTLCFKGSDDLLQVCKCACVRANSLNVCVMCGSVVGWAGLGAVSFAAMWRDGTVWCGLRRQDNPISGCHLTTTVSFMSKLHALNTTSAPPSQLFSLWACLPACVCRAVCVYCRTFSRRWNHKNPAAGAAAPPASQTSGYSDTKANDLSPVQFEKYRNV